MRPRVTWKVGAWSEGAMAEQSDGIRATYGAAIADVVEMYRTMVAERRDQPAMQDIKYTLKALVAKPTKANIADLDTITSSFLMSASMARFGSPDEYLFDADALSQCAQSALANLPEVNGRTATDPLAVMLVRALLDLVPDDVGATERDKLLSAALEACRLGYDIKTVERLRAKAGQVL